jgi:amidohydrolase
MYAELRETVQAQLDGLVSLRHALHQHPEIRFEEHQTSARIADWLTAAGIPHTRGHAKGTGIVATIEGAHEGPTIALRADMDALELEEQTGLPYASTIPGRMHACGHDGHSTILCGAGQVLQQHRARLHGRVKLIFQPAEEQAAGGRYIVEEGILDDVQAVFALHAWPSLGVGTVGIGSGCMMAGADFFRIDIHGRGGHGADPARAIDPIIVAAHMVTALQTLVSRETNPWDAAVVTVATLHAGTTSNIIPETAWMEGTFRSLQPGARQALAEGVSRIATHTAQAFRASATVDFGDHAYPPLFNHPQTTALARAHVSDVFGEHAVIDLDHPFMTAEDFAFYLQKTPGTFLFLGNRPRGSDASPGLHSPYFDFNDDALALGAEMLAGLALRAALTPAASAQE